MPRYAVWQTECILQAAPLPMYLSFCVWLCQGCWNALGTSFACQHYGSFNLILEAAASHRKTQENIQQFPSRLHKCSGGCLNHPFLSCLFPKHKTQTLKKRNGSVFRIIASSSAACRRPKVPTSAVLGRSARSLFQKRETKRETKLIVKAKTSSKSFQKSLNGLSSPSWIDKMPFNFDI